jgi:hypothetical protein
MATSRVGALALGLLSCRGTVPVVAPESVDSRPVEQAPAAISPPPDAAPPTVESPPPEPEAPRNSAAPSSAAGEKPDGGSQAKFNPAEENIETLARRYRALLRKQRTPGVFQEDLDGWNGERHRILGELGARLGDGHHRTETVRHLMGPPNHIARRGSSLWLTAQPQGNGTTEVWIYEWRGLHDFLYFECRGTLVLRADFWFAGE